MDHIRLCRVLGWCLWAAFRLLSQIYSPDLALHHEFGRSLAGRDRGRLGNAGWTGGWRGLGAAPQELRFGLYRAVEHAAGPRIPLYRAGDAHRYRSRLQQTVGSTAGRGPMSAPGEGRALEVVQLKKAFGGLIVTDDVSLAI